MTWLWLTGNIIPGDTVLSRATSEFVAELSFNETKYYKKTIQRNTSIKDNYYGIIQWES